MTATPTEPSFETARLRLRPIEPGDAPRVAELANDFDIARMTAVMPFPYRLEHAETFIARIVTRMSGVHATFAIDLADDGLAGVIGFQPGEGFGPEVGYWLGRAYWNRGFATEALTASLGWAAAERGVRCVTAGHFLDNPASGAVLERAGFLPTGRVEPCPCAARGAPQPSRRLVWLA